MIFNNGLIPSHYTNKFPRKLLKAYVDDYLTQEVQFEGFVRNLSAFSRFIDSIAFSHAEMINYSNIARDCSIDSKTIKEYYQILVDLVGYLIYPYNIKLSRKVISAVRKFYFFDIGIVNRIINRNITELRGIEAGKCLEHYIFLELKAYIGLNDLDHKIYYWRTKTGIEVDFIIEDRGKSLIPIEVKI